MAKVSEWKRFAKSFDLFNVDTAFIILYELVFCGVMYLLGILFYGQVLKELQGLKQVNLNQAVMLANPEVITQNIDLVHGVLGKLGLYLVLMLASASFIYAFFNMLIWSRIANKRLTQNFMTKWIVHDFLWALAWCAIAGAALFIFEIPYVIFILAGLFFAFLHVSLHFHIVLTQRNDRVVKKALEQATVGIPKYIIPYVLMIVTYWVATFIVMQGVVSIPWNPVVFAIIYFIIAITWMRKYIFEVTT